MGQRQKTQARLAVTSRLVGTILLAINRTADEAGEQASREAAAAAAVTKARSSIGGRLSYLSQLLYV